MRLRTTFIRLARDRRGISMAEFALVLPIFLGAIFAVLEMSQFTVATQRMQRISANMGDLVAQSGTAGIGSSESQMNDIIASMQYAAKPFKLKERGRVIITAVQGQRDPTNGNQVRNRKLWHRCDGQFAGRPNKLPGTINSWIELPSGRVLLEDEILIHSQLAYQFEPLTNVNIGDMWNPQSRVIERSAFFRPRSRNFVSLTPDGTTAKSDCPTA